MSESYRPATARAVLDALLRAGMVKVIGSTLADSNLILSKVGEALIADQSDALEYMQIPGLYTLATQETPQVDKYENPMAAELRKP